MTSTTSIMVATGTPILFSRPAPSGRGPTRLGHHGASIAHLGCSPRLTSTNYQSAISFPAAHLFLGGRLYSALPRTICKTSASGALDVVNGGGGAGGWQGRGGGGGGGGDEGDSEFDDKSDDGVRAGIFEALRRGWRERVRADPQFGFKVFSEVVIGVAACVAGDMASRPNFGLNELDFVFSTIVVGSILNFTLMYMLAPTAAAGQASQQLPLLFAACPPGHMFEPGNYSLLDRVGTFVYKGVLFATVGFFAGMGGTALSNMLLSVRKKIDPKFEMQNKPPPPVLNAVTWAGHMGLSSNARYQTLNGLEFALAGMLNPAAFKSAVFVLRGLNNVLGGMTFVMLARKTGSQSAPSPKADLEDVFLAEKSI